MKLVLASQSPRRKELLLDAGYEFTVSTVKVSEIFDESLNPSDVPSHLATIKAKACVEQHKELKKEGFLILAADTLVLLGDQILGKPGNAAEAADFLRRLSGKTHRVITGLALLPSGPRSTQVWTASEVTEVKFRDLSAVDIEAYVDSGEPMDKAGAYAIQGEGGKFVSSFSGSWSNVVGLPLERLERALSENGWTVGRGKPQKS